ncbi:MAG: hypothetical protein ACLU21_08765, partial [Angelakisella sp.]
GMGRSPAALPPMARALRARAYRRLRRRGLRPILPSAPASKKEPPFSSLFPAPLTPAAPR